MQGKRKQIQKLNILFASIILMLSTVVICIYMRGELTAEDISPATIRLNEICSSNFSVSGSEDGNYYDYIELYNPTDKEISLEGYALSDSTENLRKFVFGNRIIAPKGYVVVYGAGEGCREGYAPFKISDSGENIILTDENGSVLDLATVPSGMKYNTSYGRKNDGSGEWEILEATPEKSNEAAAVVLPENMDPPVFSVEGGFYEKPFLLELKAKNNEEIFYTVDGSEPTRESKHYSSPILVEDVSEKENVHSARTDLSAAFFAEENRFEVPTEKVDKAVIIRAAVFDREGIAKSKTITKTYFVGYDEKDYEDFSVISLVTEPDNLFDYEKGIYVSGKRFDDFINNGEIWQTNNPENWRRWIGNYSNRGREWERPVHIELFDENRELLFAQDGGLRIKGGTSRSFTQKSLSLYARKIYSGKDTFEVPLFGENGKRRAVLFSGAQDYRTKTQDVLLNSLLADRAFSVAESYPCYVFLDGEYWGIYHLMETYNDDYLAEHYQVPKGEGIIIRNGELDTDAPGSEVYVQEIQKVMEAETQIDRAEYEKICSIIDMRSYIDYYAAQIYINRGENDWPKVNEAFWRTINDEGEGYLDGRWRWMLFDTNWACLNSPEENTIAYTKEKSGFFRRLCENENFVEEFVRTMCDLTNKNFHLENVAPKFMELSVQMRSSVIRDLKKYYGENKKPEEYDEDITDMSEFFINRPANMMQHLASEFGLTGTLENVSVGCSKGGSVLLNTVEIPEGTECWTGQYFTDYPIQVTAIPAEGYRFVGWNGDVVSSAAEMEVTIKTGGMVLQAVFEKE